MNKEKTKARMLICELKEREYLEVGNTKTANRYHNELREWEDLLSQLNPILSEERNNYKRGYLNLQQGKENLIKYLETPIDTKLFDKSIDYVNGYIEANSIILNMLKGGKYE